MNRMHSKFVGDCVSLNRIVESVYSKFGEENVIEVFSDHVIVRNEDSVLSIKYSVKDSDICFEESNKNEEYESFVINEMIGFKNKIDNCVVKKDFDVNFIKNVILDDFDFSYNTIIECLSLLLGRNTEWRKMYSESKFVKRENREECSCFECLKSKIVDIKEDFKIDRKVFELFVDDVKKIVDVIEMSKYAYGGNDEKHIVDGMIESCIYDFVGFYNYAINS